MMRETIILSDLDLSILKFLKEEKFIKDLVIKFGIDYLMMKLHLDRLRSIRCIDTCKFGTFKRIKTNSKGVSLLNIL